MESIFYNLISNAIKYRSSDRTPVINISAKKAGDIIKIAVSDNRMGIDLDKNKKLLFGLYQHFNVDVAGKGLGLHMTKNHVEALGGNISVESEVGKGTSFMVILPTR